MELKLKGIPAIIAVILVIAGVIGYRIFLQADLPKDPEVRRQLELNLMSEIAGDIIADTEAIEQAIASGDEKTASALAEGLLKRKVEIENLAIKGGGENIIVRATYTIHNPNGSENKTGYFKYSHSPITGWRYRREVSSLSWYLKLI